VTLHVCLRRLCCSPGRGKAIASTSQPKRPHCTVSWACGSTTICGLWVVPGLISGVISDGSLRITALDGVDPVVSDGSAGGVAHPRYQVKIRPRSVTQGGLYAMQVLSTYVTDPEVDGVCTLALMWAFRTGTMGPEANGLILDLFGLSLGLI
jgi:hypothetical protein